MFVCFLDASKAFDQVNHSKQFQKLSSKRVPSYLIRILVFWYANQTMMVKWEIHYQILSKLVMGYYPPSYLTCIWTSYSIGYLFCPYSTGLQHMLKICSYYGIEFDVKFNSKTSHVMFVKTKEDRQLVFPQFLLSGKVLNVCNKVTYLGHFCTDDLSDDADIE